MNLLSTFPLIPLNSQELTHLIPIFVLSVGAVLALLLATHKKQGHALACIASLVVICLAIISISWTIFDPTSTLLGGSLVFSPYTKTLSLMILVFALFGIVLTYGQDKKEGLLSEVYALILFATSGMLLMVSTSHLLFMFIALEIMSLAIYVLVAMRRSSQFSAEAGLKYFILGGLASALYLYGSSLVFGATGSLELSTIQNTLMGAGTPSFLFFIGLGLMITAMLFKIGAFPFHGWVPDVYQGASTNITAFMGAAVKFTGFLAFTRIVQHLVFVDHIPGLQFFQSFIWIAAVASMIYGNFVALSQKELKRMLAFSTIAHSGYLLVGMVAMSRANGTPEFLVLYLFFYALASLGAFGVISLFESKNQKDLTLDQIAGLGLKHPVLGAILTIFLLSMAGIPLTSGFIGKYGLFGSAINAGEIVLVVIAILTSIVSLYYYLRVVVYIFMKEPTSESASYQSLFGPSFAVFVSAALTLQFGLFPGAIIHFLKMITE